MSGSRPVEVPTADESRLLPRVLLATACLITGATSQWAALQLTAGRLLQVQDPTSLNFVGPTTNSRALANTTWYTGSAFSLGDPAPRSKP
jgi:hypothetical protein